MTAKRYQDQVLKPVLEMFYRQIVEIIHLLVMWVFDVVVNTPSSALVMRRAVVQFPAHPIPFLKIPTWWMSYWNLPFTSFRLQTGG
jgi:hypothetical protein